MEKIKVEQCSKCHDTGMVQEPNGSIHTCWECMREGRLNQHSEKLPDNKIKL